MNNIYSAVKLTTLIILLTVSLICVLSEPADNENWFLIFISSKIAGIVTAYVFYRLAKHWHCNDIKTITRYCDEEDL
ncbi:membrane protein [gut metagenome]|uniref:Membrane protein n=1 Tax=gut metagenome TaxID=749906 RepID=J9GKS9_9ZZZZ